MKLLYLFAGWWWM